MKCKFKNSGISGIGYDCRHCKYCEPIDGIGVCILNEMKKEDNYD